jgi:hypothetical protein
MSELAGKLAGIAGIVKTPGVDDALEAIESEADVVAANMELLEGRPLTDGEREQWARLFNDVMREVNKRLEPKGIMLLAACPEPNGLGGVLTGCDRVSLDAASRGVHMPSEEYTVTISLPARERVDIARTGREEFVRALVDHVCVECIEQQVAYRAKREFFS